MCYGINHLCGIDFKEMDGDGDGDGEWSRG
jgi:hypothetical protein